MHVVELCLGAPALRRALLQHADRVAVAGSGRQVAQLALLQAGREREHRRPFRQAALQHDADHRRGDGGLVGVDDEVADAAGVGLGALLHHRPEYRPPK